MTYKRSSTICDVLRDLVPFLQFKKRKKHSWKSVNTPPWVFFMFFIIVQMVPNRATNDIVDFNQHGGLEI